ncbi:hypothetical protein [Pseudomonas saxonica]|uniref:Uncharacterized protein n=1 Tax=Pseudomonas saxonica TaxID=2600598 RepID=A0A5C5Q2N9_9PSED|nr:hypothetical protein [Pseudomonas saxonica]TWR94249.1 hypothetical protein FJD37_11180 [Pseudomonas saxonica]
MNTHQKMRTFDRIRDAVLPEYRERVAEYLVLYEDVLNDPTASQEAVRSTALQLRGYLRGLNTTRVLGMADLEDLDSRIIETWL